MKREIRDRYGSLIGTIAKGHDRRIEARDKLGRLLGTYDPESDETRDAGGRMVCKGDGLASLMPMPKS